MLQLLFVIILSLSFSSYILKRVSQDKVLFNFNLIVLITWYLPILISFILPFDYFGIKSISFPTTFLALFSINLIVFGNALAFQKFRKKKKLIRNENKNNNLEMLQKPTLINKKEKHYYHTIYLALAYVACALELFRRLKRGYNFSLEEIDSNRLITIQAHDADIYSFLVGLASGFIYYMLFFAISIDKNSNHKNRIRININWIYLTPYLLYSFLVFISGRKSTIIYGIVILLLKFICFNKLNVTKIIALILSGLIFIVGLTTIHNAMRTSSIETVDDHLRVINIIVRTDKDSPLISYVQKLPPYMYIGLANLYLYLGVQYDMLYATMSLEKRLYSVPLGFISVQPLYRAFALALGQNDKSPYGEFKSFQQQLENKYGAIGNVWGTIFSILYIEGGFILLLLFVPFFFALNYYLTYKYLIKPTDNNKFIFLMVNLILITFAMNTPFKDTVFISMIIASMMKKQTNYVCKLFLGIKKNQQTDIS